MAINDSTNEKQIEELEEKIRNLRCQNDALKKKLTDRKLAQIGWLKAIAKLSFRLTLGSSLNKALQAWLSSYETHGSLPKQESIDVVTAIFHRIIRVGLVGAILSIFPTFLLIWQNLLLQAQLRDQRLASYIARKSELTAILYETTCEPSEPRGSYYQVPSSSCPPKANKRSRSEATRAFLEIERLLSSFPDLTGALLSETWLIEVDLRKVKLFQTDFRSANLGSADFRGGLLDAADFTKANLAGADFRGAIIQDVNFIQANLVNADFRGVKFFSTDFRGADLIGAQLNSVDLRFSDLRDADLSLSNLNKANLTDAWYNDGTIWPSQFDVGSSGAIKCASVLGPPISGLFGPPNLGTLPKDKTIVKGPCELIKVSD